MTAAGSLSTLNVGEGDITVTFNGKDDKEVDQALDMLSDMVKRGYAILVKQPSGKYLRAHSIDRESKSYIVMEPHPFSAAKGEVRVTRVDGEQESPAGSEPPAAPAKAGKRGRPARQAIGSSHAVGVGRSAGG
jgi:hypothetical protein